MIYYRYHISILMYYDVKIIYYIYFNLKTFIFLHIDIPISLTCPKGYHNASYNLELTPYGPPQKRHPYGRFLACPLRTFCFYGRFPLRTFPLTDVSPYGRSCYGRFIVRKGNLPKTSVRVKRKRP